MLFPPRPPSLHHQRYHVPWRRVMARSDWEISRRTSPDARASVTPKRAIGLAFNSKWHLPLRAVLRCSRKPQSQGCIARSLLGSINEEISGLLCVRLDRLHRDRLGKGILRHHLALPRSENSCTSNRDQDYSRSRIRIFGTSISSFSLRST